MKEQVLKNTIPNHIAVIMDGNGRWAKSKGLLRMFGHQSGVKAVRETTEICAELGVKFLTLYAFSSENWSRPQAEVNLLMNLLIQTIKDETPTLLKNNIKLESIGNVDLLPNKCKTQLEEAKEITKNATGLTLILALSYGAKTDLTNAVKSIGLKLLNHQLRIDDINEQTISNHLSTNQYPNPELMIRTSGEQRLSNFLLWELAYSEFYFTDVLWPDFRKEHLIAAIHEFQNRERRFGKTEEQIQA